MSAFDKDTFIAYRKVPSIDTVVLKKNFNGSSEDFDNKYNPFDVTSIQNYQPIHSFFFNMNEDNYDSFQLNHKHHFKDFDTVIEVNLKSVFNLTKAVYFFYSIKCK